MEEMGASKRRKAKVLKFPTPQDARAINDARKPKNNATSKEAPGAEEAKLTLGQEYITSVGQKVESIKSEPEISEDQKKYLVAVSKQEEKKVRKRKIKTYTEKAFDRAGGAALRERTQNAARIAAELSEAAKNNNVAPEIEPDETVDHDAKAHKVARHREHTKADLAHQAYVTEKEKNLSEYRERLAKMAEDFESFTFEKNLLLGKVEGCLTRVLSVFQHSGYGWVLNSPLVGKIRLHIKDGSAAIYDETSTTGQKEFDFMIGVDASSEEIEEKMNEAILPLIRIAETQDLTKPEIPEAHPEADSLNTPEVTPTKPESQNNWPKNRFAKFLRRLFEGGN